MIFQPDEHWFGLRPPDNTAVRGAFGLRAILEGRPRHQTLDIVAGRQSFFPPDTPFSPEFDAFLKTELTAWLRNRCGQTWINPCGEELYTLAHPNNPRLRANASALRSQGYLYVGAYELA